MLDGAAVVVHGRHAVAILQGWDARLIDEGDGVAPEPLEGVKRLLDAGICKLPCVFNTNPRLVLFSIHPTAFDHAWADVNEVALFHWIPCCACVQRAKEELREELLKTIGGLPIGGYSLSILLSFFGHCDAIFFDEPIKHMEEDSVW
jgi:hypothetical protein